MENRISVHWCVHPLPTHLSQSRIWKTAGWDLSVTLSKFLFLLPEVTELPDNFIVKNKVICKILCTVFKRWEGSIRVHPLTVFLLCSSIPTLSQILSGKMEYLASFHSLKLTRSRDLSLLSPTSKRPPPLSWVEAHTVFHSLCSSLLNYSPCSQPHLLTHPPWLLFQKCKFDHVSPLLKIPHLISITFRGKKNPISLACNTKSFVIWPLFITLASSILSSLPCPDPVHWVLALDVLKHLECPEQAVLTYLGHLPLLFRSDGITSHTRPPHPTPATPSPSSLGPPGPSASRSL